MCSVCRVLSENNSIEKFAWSCPVWFRMFQFCLDRGEQWIRECSPYSHPLRRQLRCPFSETCFSFSCWHFMLWFRSLIIYFIYDPTTIHAHAFISQRFFKYIQRQNSLHSIGYCYIENKHTRFLMQIVLSVCFARVWARDRLHNVCLLLCLYFHYFTNKKRPLAAVLKWAIKRTEFVVSSNRIHLRSQWEPIGQLASQIDGRSGKNRATKIAGH